ncbi:MAG TPA: hypothetical protein VG709_06570, partial [Actinomycetota bacterium]|nr:hypothetical protein [Actinomycetota bacterium]
VLPDRAMGVEGGLVDVASRMSSIFGVDAADTLRSFPNAAPELVETEHAAGGRAVFLRARRLDGSAGGETTRALRDALARLVEPDIEIDNEEVFALHRVNGGRDVYFLVNTTFEPQAMTVRMPGELDAAVWDPSSGEERVPESRVADGRTELALELGPVGSVVITPEVRGTRAATPALGRPAATVAVDGEWRFRAEDPNALVLDRWRAAPEAPGASAEGYAAPDVDDDGWQPVGPGAWAFQLPSEPDRPWPIPVWYRFSFATDRVPSSLHLVVDGFAGSDRRVFLNGEEVTTEPVRSPFDSQMKTIDLSGHVGEGRNVLAVRLTLESSTDGVTDLLKLIGGFGVSRGDDGVYRIVPPVERVKPASWTDQGYPFYSGVGVYSTAVEVPPGFAAGRVFLEAPAGDDALEVVVNGRSAGVRLWPPYAAEVTGLLRDGDNEIELRVANTLANLLNGDERASGLAEEPRLVAYG